MSNKPKNYRNQNVPSGGTQKKSKGILVKAVVVALCVIMAVMFSAPAFMLH